MARIKRAEFLVQFGIAHIITTGRHVFINPVTKMATPNMSNITSLYFSTTKYNVHYSDKSGHAIGHVIV